ncbi:MAG: hypothetical protein HYT16_01360 [DPANN group archaeon]|nr:hypothetical protein [DPANN group archaeon]
MAETQVRKAPVIGDFPAIASKLILAKKMNKFMLPIGAVFGVAVVPMFLIDPLWGAGMVAYFAGVFGGSYFYQTRRVSKVNDALLLMSVPRIEGGQGWCLIRQNYSAPVERLSFT